MKRGEPLRRVTPLRARSRLKSNSAGRKPSRPKRDPAEKSAREIVRERSGGLCEVQLTGLCLGRATNYQHRVNRSQGGEYAPSAALDCCGSGSTGCHGFITENPAVAYTNGWSVRSWDDPLTRPVLYRGKWVVLDDEGGYTEAFGAEAA